MTSLGENSALAAAELAHEIKNILVMIESAAHLLRPLLPSDAAELAIVDEMLIASERVAAAAKRLMVLARDETARGYPCQGK